MKGIWVIYPFRVHSPEKKMDFLKGGGGCQIEKIVLNFLEKRKTIGFVANMLPREQ